MKLRNVLLLSTFISLLGVFFVSGNKEEVKPAKATGEFDYSQRYWILNKDATYGIKLGNSYGITSEAYDSLATPFYFEEVSGKTNAYYIRNLYNNDYLAGSSNSLMKHYDNHDVAGYNFEWAVVSYEGYHVITTSGGSMYFNLNTYWYTSSWDSGNTDKFKLSLISYDEACSSFVTAMRNISCDDGVTAPKVGGENSWETASEAYASLIKPAKNYLPYVRANKDASDMTIEWAIAKYDYIVSKYNRTETIYSPFVNNRNVNELMFDIITYPSNDEKNYFIIIFTVSFTVLFTSLTILYQKKKNK